MKTTIEINETNFALEVLQSDKPVLVDFWADWCGPCKMLAPVLEEIAAAQPGVKIAKVNVDQNPALAARYGIQSIPTLLYFAAGEVKDKNRRSSCQTADPFQIGKPGCAGMKY